jgi:cation diffusion facilitator family transporter
MRDAAGQPGSTDAAAGRGIRRAQRRPPGERGAPRYHPIPRLPPRRSAATARSGRNRGGIQSVVVALAANTVVAAAKLFAGLTTGSSAMLAEAVHSTADSINEVLLLVSLRRSQRPPDMQHPFGHGRERFLWAFLATICSFVVGGCLSIALAVDDLTRGSELDRVGVAGIVLAVALLADGTSFARTVRQARREARSWGLTTVAYLRETNDPTLRAIAVEDGAALVGIALAAAGILVPALGGPAAADAIASLLIGLLLAATAVGLARPLADLLIGKSISPARLERAYAILSEASGIDEVLTVYTVHVGAQEAILAAKVHPSPGQTGADLACLLDELDRQLRDALPEIGEVFIDVTSHRRTPEHDPYR